YNNNLTECLRVMLQFENRSNFLDFYNHNGSFNMLLIGKISILAGNSEVKLKKISKINLINENSKNIIFEGNIIDERIHFNSFIFKNAYKEVENIENKISNYIQISNKLNIVQNNNLVKTHRELIK